MNQIARNLTRIQTIGICSLLEEILPHNWRARCKTGSCQLNVKTSESSLKLYTNLSREWNIYVRTLFDKRLFFKSPELTSLGWICTRTKNHAFPRISSVFPSFLWKLNVHFKFNNIHHTSTFNNIDMERNANWQVQIILTWLLITGMNMIDLIATNAYHSLFAGLVLSSPLKISMRET